MLDEVRYVTDEDGNQVGVLLDITEYRALSALKVSDPELLTSLSQEELEALANSQLATEAQSRLNELLMRHREGRLTAVELQELDDLLEQVDQLTILKTRARYTLENQVAQAK